MTRRAQWAWCLFDFANSPFNTVVLTFLYAPFFAGRLAGEKAQGDAMWAFMFSASGVAIALLAPFVGARADRSAHKRRALVLSTAVVIACTALLAVPSPDPVLGRASDAALWTVLVLVAVANVAFELAFVFYNAFLPQIAPPGQLGRLSGRGWACGYAGGLACLVVCLGFVGIGGIGPWVSTERDFHVRATMLVVAGWFLLFALPMFVLVRDRPPEPHAAQAPSVLHTLRGLPRQPALLRFLLAHLVYNDALMGLIALAGLYMERTLHMGMGEILLTGVVLNVLAGGGALAFGRIDDRLGPRAVILASLGLLLGGGILAVAVPTRPAFWVAASLIGIGMGPNQSASRTLLARLAPVGRSAEYFGLFALSGKATVWLAPFLFGQVVLWTGSQRLAFVPLLAMFALGFVIMLGVRPRPRDA